MLLKSIYVTNYKSIKDSGQIDINDITCLVGKNEAGKTAILEALNKLNPIIKEHGLFNVDDDYPRMEVADYKHAIESGMKKHSIVIKCEYELEDKDFNKINDFTKDIFDSNQIVLSKGYDNILYFDVKVNEHKLIKILIEKFCSKEDISKVLRRSKTIDELIIEINNNNTDNLLNNFLSIVQKIKTEKNVNHYIFNNYIQSLIPKFLYFDEFYQMEGHVNINSLVERQNNNTLVNSDYPLLGLIELSRLNLKDMINPSRTVTFINALEGASNHLTKTIIKYWSQNKYIDIKFDIRQGLPQDPPDLRNGYNLWGYVYNTKHKVSTLLGKRSRGFVWFFSFIAWFSQQRNKNIPLILLLDEPGLFLHGTAQADLLNYFEQECKKEYQVIYTTHSPFMVDSKRFDRVRIVEDKSMNSDKDLPLEKQGTKVYTDILETEEDSLFPLQGALGYEISQTLFVGPYCLIVEGVSDLLYIQIISDILRKKNMVSLNKKWTITPVGGSDKIPTFVSLLGSQKDIKVATLIDIQKKDTQKIENLYKKKLLEKKHVLTYGKFLNQDEADIEDMFGIDFYLLLVNEEFKDDLNNPIDKNNLDNKAFRLLPKIEKHLSTNPLKNNIKFNHYRPARLLLEKITNFESKISDASLKNFENAFIELNKLI